MHWLAEQLKQLGELGARHQQYRDLASVEVAGSATAEKRAREAFLAAVGELVQEISNRAGVLACFAAHEGLLVEMAGEYQDFEALAAMAQSCLEAGQEAGENLQLGALRQMVIIGQQRKLALFALGQIAVGILARGEAHLAQTLES